MRTEIAITGMSVLSGAGGSASALCKHCVDGKNAASDINIEAYENDLVSVNSGERELYRIQKMLFIAFLKASRMARAGSEAILPERTGICLGNCHGLEEFRSGFFNHYTKSEPALTSPALFPFTTANALASWLAIQTGVKGANLTFISDGTSSAEAILAACDLITANECDAVFVGGISVLDLNLRDEFLAAGFRHEIAGMLLLESASHARSRGIDPIAVLKDIKNISLTKDEMAAVRQNGSILKILNKTRSNLSPDIAEMVYLGNELGDNGPGLVPRDALTSMEKLNVFPLNAVVGNIFDAAGVFGAALSVELLDRQNNGKWCPLRSSQEGILHSTVNSSGTAITMLIRKA